MSRARRRLTWIGAVVIVGGAIVGGFAFVASRDTDAADEESSTSFNTAEAVRTDLVSETIYSGTVGYVALDDLVSGGDGVITAAAEAGSTVDSGQVLFELSGQPVVALRGDVPATRDLGRWSESVDAAATTEGVVTNVARAGTVVSNGMELYAVSGEPVVAFEGDTPAYRDLQRWVETTDVNAQRDGVITWVPAVGTVLHNGDVLFEVDGEPVIALLGNVPAYRSLADQPTNLEGDDVLQLEYDLALLGLAEGNDVTVDTEFTSATATAVEALQERAGAEVDGELALGEYVFLPAEVEITSALAGVGSSVSSQTPVVRVGSGAEMSGEDVRQLEAGLSDSDFAGDDLTVDGIFDRATADALRRYQTDAGLTSDGVLNLTEYRFVPRSASVVAVVADVGASVTPQSTIIRLGAGEEQSGDDVRQLEDALVALGYGGDSLIAEGTFDAATDEALREFQEAVGAEADGELSTAEYTFSPSSLRISESLAPVGSMVNAGAPVLAVTSGDITVTIDLPAADQGAVDVGTRVVVEMPDGREVDATVTSVSRTGVASNDDVVFPVTIQLDDDTAAQDLESAPVDVSAVTDSVEGVVAVPVAALIVPREGGYAVEVVDGPLQTHLVAVEPGFFSDGLVEITGDVNPGALVVVP